MPRRDGDGGPGVEEGALGHVEQAEHRLVAEDFQRVCLARRLVDEAAAAGDPSCSRYFHIPWSVKPTTAAVWKCKAMPLPGAHLTSVTKLLFFRSISRNRFRMPGSPGIHGPSSLGISKPANGAALRKIVSLCIDGGIMGISFSRNVSAVQNRGSNISSGATARLMD
jgi:hypothetical protein